MMAKKFDTVSRVQAARDYLTLEQQQEIPLTPQYALTMLLDAQQGQTPVLSDVELLAASYLIALEALAETDGS